VFANFAEHNRTKFRKDAKKQTLRANAAVVFGAFAPGCVNETCDQLPTLQCLAERDGNTIVVQSQYYVDHKDGSTCTDTCRPITAGGKTPILEAGKYTVRYGARTFELRIPSVLRAPCFKMD
jgi:hypothetical protein